MDSGLIIMMEVGLHVVNGLILMKKRYCFLIKFDLRLWKLCILDRCDIID